MKIFVTDANYKHSLAAVRSLGQKGFEITAGASYKNAQAFFSKYCKTQVIYPDPKSETEFISFMLDYVKNHQIDVILPIGYAVSVAFSKNIDKFLPYTKIPITSWPMMEKAANKDETMILAKKVGLETPHTYQNIEEIKHFPVVVKSIKESGGIKYINSLEELKQANYSNCIIQEYIPGDGYGFFALFDHGQEKAIFMHKRLRQYPITGGSSTAAESIYDQDLLDAGLKLLKALNWHGVAMVEFKKDARDNKFKLMEINPKFWGSLDLAIASGVDFPYLTVEMVTKSDIKPVLKYKTGVKFHWPFAGDFLFFTACPESRFKLLLEAFDPRVKSNIWLSDLKPNLRQIYSAFNSFRSHLKNHDLKYPHGCPTPIKIVAELHLHSKYSFDCLLCPANIVRRAKKKGLNTIAITDHNTIRGALEAKAINLDPNFSVIIGSEIETDQGDIIGLFLTQEIESRKCLEVIAEIHEQGGIAVLPHPYKVHKLDDQLLNLVDVIEISNAKDSLENDQKARKLAEKYHKPMIVGSDAHFLSQIGKNRNIFWQDLREGILQGKASFITSKTLQRYHSLGKIIKLVKQKKYNKLPLELLHYLILLVKGL